MDHRLVTLMLDPLAQRRARLKGALVQPDALLRELVRRGYLQTSAEAADKITEQLEAWDIRCGNSSTGIFA